MTERYGVLELYGDRPGLEIVKNKQGEFVHYSDYEECAIALDRLLYSYRNLLARKSVRDVEETIAEAENVLEKFND